MMLPPLLLLLMLTLLLQVVDVMSFNFINYRHRHRHCHHHFKEQKQVLFLPRPPRSFRRQQPSTGTRTPLLTLRSSSLPNDSDSNQTSHNEAVAPAPPPPPTTTTGKTTATVDTNNNTTGKSSNSSSSSSNLTEEEHDIYKSVEQTLQHVIDKMVHQVMTPEFFLCADSNSNSNHLKQLYTKSTKMVEVKPSTIGPTAGLGLFATKNIKSGTIISMYPAHTLGVELPLSSGSSKEIWVTASHSENDRIYFTNNPPSSASPYLHATDQPIFGRPSLLATKFPQLKDLPIYLDVNPNNHNHNHDEEELQKSTTTIWVSQYINDGAIVETYDQNGIEMYYKQSTKRKNCIHIPFGPSPIMATITTRKIKKGEELFTSYGCVYWLGSLSSVSETTSTSSTTTATTTATTNDDGSSPGLVGPGMNTQIQSQIQQSAQDLFHSMKTCQTIYQNQIESFEQAYTIRTKYDEH